MRWTLFTLTLAASLALGLPAGLRAQQLFEYYPETGQYVQGEYLRWYLAKGGPAVLGYPRTPDFRERDRLVQYFQTIRLEWDCGKDGRAPCRLRPGTLGEEILGRKLDLPPDQQTTGSSGEGSRYFGETNTTVSGAFLSRFDELGGLDFFGYPLTDPVVEAGQTVQWFQRARLQLDPDGVVRLSRLGDYWIDTLKRVSAPYLLRRPAPAPLPALSIAARAPQGRFVFQTATGQIVQITADGSGERVLTSGHEPALSPDGSRLAFGRGDPPSIWLLDLASGEERLLVAEPGVRSPVWSPDGSRLAILKSKRDPVFRIDPATRRPGWLLEEHFGIAVVDVASGTLIDLPSQTFSSAPSWSPDGQQIVFDGNTGLYLVPTDGSGEPRLLPGTNSQFTQPAWSPDGSLIALALRRNDHYDLAVIRPDGRGLRLLTESPFLTRASNNVAPAWSPDGQQIIFLSDRHGSWQLYTIDVDGRNLRPVFAGANPLTFRYAKERVVSWGRP
jgi:dipeptidyl aminopeptidase/acylaminoacyl peptidase